MVYEHYLQNLLTAFGHVVRLQREGLEISQEELAFRSGLHRTYITDVERGVRNMTLESALKLTRALSITLSEAFDKAADLAVLSPARGDAVNLQSRSAVEILIIDDNPRDAEFTVNALQRNGVSNRILTATTGEEAVTLLFGKDGSADSKELSIPKVILLDLRLPDMDGLDILQQIRANERTRSIPVVVLTASRSDQDYKRSVNLGITGYITKPVDFIEFSTLMAKIGLRWLLLAHK